MTEPNTVNTAARAFDILKKLCEKDCQPEELLCGFSDDTLRLYLNSMKLCGINFSSPTRVKKEYSLVENLDFLNFSLQDYKNLLNIKKIISQEDTYNEVIEFNNFIEKLAKYTGKAGKEKLLKILDAKPFSPKLHDMIFEIEKAVSLSKLLLIKYTSPNSLINYFKILPKYLKIQNSKIYVYGTDASIKEVRYLPLIRIKSLKIIDEPVETVDVGNYAICRFNPLKNDMNKFENIKILEKTPEKVIAKIYYENTFEFIQKVLNCAKDCIILEPQDIKKEVANIIKEVGELYAK
ncbi:MAG: WYL domain-containing protein [bacterium]|nr:WYL domain-containing protein [bacterium]